MELRTETKGGSRIWSDMTQEMYHDIDHSGRDELSNENRVMWWSVLLGYRIESLR